MLFKPGIRSYEKAKYVFFFVYILNKKRYKCKLYPVNMVEITYRQSKLDVALYIFATASKLLISSENQTKNRRVLSKDATLLLYLLAENKI